MTSVQSEGAAIDRAASVPESLRHEAIALLKNASSDALALVITIEEIAAASAAVAMAGAAGDRKPAVPLGLSGLRGAASLDGAPRAQLTLAAVALGLGRAALDAALRELRQAAGAPGKDGEKPHWVVADAATELEAARMLTYKAAQAGSGEAASTAVALARLMASSASQRSVDAALRIIGIAGLQEGAPVERLARDIKAVALLMGTEEQQRATAAEGLLPHGAGL